jgi:hypothetical protein
MRLKQKKKEALAGISPQFGPFFSSFLYVHENIPDSLDAVSLALAPGMGTSLYSAGLAWMNC